VIDNCTVAACKSAGIRCGTGGDPVVRGCKVRENEGDGIVSDSAGSSGPSAVAAGGAAGAAGAGHGGGCCHGTFENNEIEDNLGAGMRVLAGSNPSVSANLVARNCAAGLHVSERGGGLFKENRIQGHVGEDGGVCCEAGCTARLAGNWVSDNYVGVRVRGEQSQPAVEGGSVSSNETVGVMIEQVCLSSSSLQIALSLSSSSSSSSSSLFLN
jgi:hypothetical protein